MRRSGGVVGIGDLLNLTIVKAGRDAKFRELHFFQLPVRRPEDRRGATLPKAFIEVVMDDSIAFAKEPDHLACLD